VDESFDAAHAYFLEGRLADAAAVYRRIVEADPGHARAHVMLALALLAEGRYEEGWREFEWRIDAAFRAARAMDKLPLWDGRPLAGRRILLHAEQGFGDNIQFVRYAPLVAARGGRVVVFCLKELKRLFASVAGAVEVLGEGDDVRDVRFQAPFMSLPRIFGTAVDTIPRTVPYLRAEAGRVARWRRRLGGGKLKVGLCWASNPENPVSRQRDATLADLEPVLGVAGARFFSLQLGSAREALSSSGHEGRVLDLGADVEASADGFSEAAAIMDCLDLVVSVDTAAVHLAGALGRPCWLALPFACDWRWLRGRDDSPWYPTARLFRQPAPGAWGPVFEAMAEELAARA
jgi:tetratricopeptide (TPR) repeat protein